MIQKIIVCLDSSMVWAGLLFSALLLFGMAEAKVPSRVPHIEYVQGEVIAKLHSSTTMTKSDEKAALLRSLAPLGVIEVTAVKIDPRFVKMTFQGDASMKSFLTQVQRNPAVIYAEPNFIYKAAPMDTHTKKILTSFERQTSTDRRFPNDPEFGQNWGLLNRGQLFGVSGTDIDATLAWTTGTGSKDMLVAVLDSGIDYKHPDLAANMWTNPREIAGNGIDDDANGFIDDVHGYNFVKNNGDPSDDNGHGTHCAGTIGAVGDNGIGTVGVNWRVNIMGLKFLKSSGTGTLEHAFQAVKYATKMHVNVMSNSWGTGGYSEALKEAIEEARDAGILFVAAAGNEASNNDISATYPADYNVSNVISVAASDNRETMARWSNYGSHSVHLTAPGVDVFSTKPRNSYAIRSGTSMAVPHVSGAAVLLWSLNRTWNFSQVKDRLLATVDPVTAFASRTLSGGRLNLNNALHNIVLPRIAPYAESDQWRPVENYLESDHQYANNSYTSVEVEYPGAKYIRVHFARVSAEKNFDFVRVLSPKGEEFDALSGEITDHTSNFVEGEKLIINFISDEVITGWGWVVDRVDYVM